MTVTASGLSAHEQARLAELRCELPKVDLGYVRKNYPQHLRLAERYDRARAAVDPDNESSTVLARRALKRLMATGIR